jgi:hypothetical protein
MYCEEYKKEKAMKRILEKGATLPPPPPGQADVYTIYLVQGVCIGIMAYIVYAEQDAKACYIALLTFTVWAVLEPNLWTVEVVSEQ